MVDWFFIVRYLAMKTKFLNLVAIKKADTDFVSYAKFQKIAAVQTINFLKQPPHFLIRHSYIVLHYTLPFNASNTHAIAKKPIPTSLVTQSFKKLLLRKLSIF